MTKFARQAIDAGGDIVVAQGCHGPFRGIEIYNGKPIFYDPGDFLMTSNAIPHYPREYYTRHSAKLAVPTEEALPIDGIKASHGYHIPVAPVGGYFGEWESSGAVMMLDYQHGKLAGIELHPFCREANTGEPADFPAVLAGLPLKPTIAHAEEILRKFVELSNPFGTAIRIEGGVGYIAL